jgi:hypothetical protein
MNDIKAQQSPTLSHIILFGMFVSVLLGNFLWKLSASLYAPFDLLAKLFPIIALGLLIGFMRVRLNFYWWAATLFYVLYLFYGVLISYLHGKGMKLILVQLYHEFKFFPLVALFSLCIGDMRWIDISKKVVTIIILFSLPLVALQLAIPGIYNAIFPDGGHINMGFLGPLVLQRAAGSFWHAAHLAMFSTISFVFIAALYRKGLIERSMPYLFILTVYLLLTIQRFEWLLHGMVILILLVRRYMDFDYRVYITYLFATIFFVFFFVVISDSANYWAIYENFYNERTEFLFHAFWELDGSGYLGAGWGTIGSHTAKDIADVYQYNGMKDLWWVQENKAYFYDTYWPHVIGETGIPGFVFLVLSMTMILRALKSPEAVLLAFIFFLTSAFSSSTQDMLFLVVYGWFIFVLENLERLHGRGGSQFDLGVKA